MLIRLVGMTSTLALALSAATGGGGIDGIPSIPGWGQLGLAGVVIVAFYTDRVVTGRKYDAMVAERDAERKRTEEERKRTEAAQEFLRDKVSEMIIESATSLRKVDEEVLPLLREVRERLDHDKENP